MKKINLEALESKNMTVAAEDMLSEINGGCTIDYFYERNACGSRYFSFNVRESCKYENKHIKAGSTVARRYFDGYATLIISNTRHGGIDFCNCEDMCGSGTYTVPQ